MSEEEPSLLGEAISALRRNRGNAWNAACDLAEAQGKRRPSLKPYGIDEIKRLARRFSTKVLHWTEYRRDVATAGVPTLPSLFRSPEHFDSAGDVLKQFGISVEAGVAFPTRCRGCGKRKFWTHPA